MLDEDMRFRLLVHFEGKLIMPGNVHGLVEEDLLVQDSQGSQGVGMAVEVGEAVAQRLLQKHRVKIRTITKRTFKGI
jgi:hypothetical protein